MNWLDFILVLIFVLNLYSGFRQGMLRQVLGLASFFIAFYLSFYLSDYLRSALGTYLRLNDILTTLAEDGVTPLWLVEIILNIFPFLLVFLFISLILSVIIKRLSIVNALPLIGPVNALLGGLIGALKGILFVFLVAGVLSLIKIEFLTDAMHSSAVVALSSHYISVLFKIIVEHLVNNLGTLV